MLIDIISAFSFLTILPAHIRSDRPPGRTFTYYPLVGGVIGLIVAGVASIPGLSPGLLAFLTLLIWVALTGGLHLDGFGDSCDGLLATVTPERRLEIMKDSRAGMWGVVGLIMLLLGKYAAVSPIDPRLLILPPVVGRWATVLAVWIFPYGRKAGVGAHFRQGFGWPQGLAATVLALAAGVGIGLWVGWLPALTLILAPLTTLIGGWWAARQLGGGLTGDIYGALCEFTELLCLIALNFLAA